MISVPSPATEAADVTSDKSTQAISTIRSRSLDKPVVSKSNTITVGIFLSFTAPTIGCFDATEDDVSFRTVEEDNTPKLFIEDEEEVEEEEEEEEEEGGGDDAVLFALGGGCHPATT